MAWLSVIVPVYNAEDTLQRCVESILSSCENDDIEIILVDDGSTDRSSIICDQFSEKYKNIKVVHQENGGVCVARNAGIRIANGKYIGFLDADDKAVPSFYASCKRIVEKQAVDLLCFGYSYISRDKKEYQNINDCIPARQILDRTFIWEKIIPPLVNTSADKSCYIDNYLANKLFDKKIIEENHVLFDEARRTWEDRSFIVLFLKYAQSMYFVPEIGYYYISTEGSLSQKFSREYFSIILKVFRQNDYLFGDELNFYTGYPVQHYCRVFLNCGLSLLDFEDKKEELRIMLTEFAEDELAQRLFCEFVPESKFERAMKDAILHKDITRIEKLLDKEKKARQGDSRWKLGRKVKHLLKSVVRKILNRK